MLHVQDIIFISALYYQPLLNYHNITLYLPSIRRLANCIQTFRFSQYPFQYLITFHLPCKVIIIIHVIIIVIIIITIIIVVVVVVITIIKIIITSETSRNSAWYTNILCCGWLLSPHPLHFPEEQFSVHFFYKCLLLSHYPLHSLTAHLSVHP